VQNAEKDIRDTGISAAEAMAAIERARCRRRMSVETLAEAAGLTWGTYYKWLRGEKTPRVDNLLRVCLALLAAEEQEVTEKNH